EVRTGTCSESRHLNLMGGCRCRASGTLPGDKRVSIRSLRRLCQRPASHQISSVRCDFVPYREQRLRARTVKPNPSEVLRIAGSARDSPPKLAEKRSACGTGYVWGIEQCVCHWSGPDLRPKGGPHMGFETDLIAKNHAGARRAPALDREALASEIAGLSKLGIDELRERWKATYGKAPSRDIGRSFLTRAIAYRLQERACGGLKPSTRRLLVRVAQEIAVGSSPKKPQNRKAQSGTVLIREWQGN